MRKHNTLLSCVLAAALIICSVFFVPTSVHAEDWYGELKTVSGATTFFGAKHAIEFQLPTPRAFDQRNDDNSIEVKISQNGKDVYNEKIELTYAEWDAQKAFVKITIPKTGSFKISVGDKSFKFKVKKASAIASYTPKPEITLKKQDDKPCVVIRGLDSGTKAKIYRRIGNGKMKLIKTVKKGEYIDTDVKVGKTYYYQVQLVAKDGKKTYTSKMSMMEGWEIS